MARYFFHVEGGPSSLDEAGTELPSLTAAKVEAARMMGELLRDQPSMFWDTQALKLIVTDAAGLILFELDLSGIEAPAISTSRRARP